MAGTSLKREPRRFFSKYSSHILLIILFVAAFLRLYRIADYMEFLGDQGRDVVVVSRFLKNGDLMFIGPQTSIGNMYLGPWYYYLIAPSLFLANFSPVGPAVMVALIGVATVWLVFMVGKELFGERIGLLSALFFAVSPVIIYYSSFSWNPNIMPPFALLSIWLVWRIWQKNEFKKLPYLAISLAMVLNSHYLGLLLFPPVAFFWFWSLANNWKKESKKDFLVFSGYAALVFLLLMSPLLVFDLKHQLVNLRAILNFFAIRQTTVNLKFYKGLFNLPQIIDQLFANLFLKQDRGPFFLGFLIILVSGLLKTRRDKAFWFIIAWLIIGLLGLANYKQHVYAHYFGFIWPVAIILTSLLLIKVFWPITLLLAGYLVFLSLINWYGWRPPNFQLQRAGKVAQFIIEQSSGQEFALALIAERNYDPPYRYFINLKNAPVVNLHQKMTEQLFVICEPWEKSDCNPIGHPLWEIAAFGWAKIDRQWQLEGIRVFRLIHNPDGKIEGHYPEKIMTGYITPKRLISSVPRI